MFNFEKLEVWKKAIDFAGFVYTTTRTFPDDERFGLTNPMRRLRFPSPRTSPKEHPGIHPMTTHAFWKSPPAPSSRSSRNHSLRSGKVICLKKTASAFTPPPRNKAGC